MSLIRLNFNTQGLCSVFMEAGAMQIDAIELYHGNEWDFELEQLFCRKHEEPLLDLFKRAVAAAQTIQMAHWRKHAHKPEPVPKQPMRLVLVDTDKQARDAAREREELADAMMRSPDDIVRLVSAIELAQNTGVLPVMGDEPIFNHMEAALDDQCSSIRKLTGSFGREIEAFAKRKNVLQ